MSPSVASVMTADTNIDIASCWSCRGAVVPGMPLCATCNAVQPPGQIDHFARFGLDRDFDLCEEELQKRYFALQRRLHPDRFAGRSAREQAISMQQSTSVNQAFEVLRTALSRAEYLLSLHGVTVNAETGNLPSDPDVLVEAMETREALSEADTEAAVAALANDVRARAAACRESLSAAFASGAIEHAARLATRLKYLEKFSEEVRRRRASLKVET